MFVFLNWRKVHLLFRIMYFIWHVIQGWSEGLIVTILLGMDLSAACIMASAMSLIFWSMLLVSCVFSMMLRSESSSLYFHSLLVDSTRPVS